MRFSLLSITLCTLSVLIGGLKSETIKSENQPKIAFSFDDGSTKSFTGYPAEQWNAMLLNALKKQNTKAVLYVKGIALDNPKGKLVMQSWSDAGHFIGNHTYSHPYFHSDKVSLPDMQNEVLKTDSMISNYSNYRKWFRFPYLKEGNTIEKRDGFRTFLNNQNYRNGHVTIDASDWYLDSRLVKRLNNLSGASIDSYKDYYINHIFARAQYYDSLATHLTNRKISHTLLLHHNLSAALFLNDLIQYFRSKGWQILNADVALTDDIYNHKPMILPAGESLIWSMAKATGHYDNALRYPAEGKQYEKIRMDNLGL